MFDLFVNDYPLALSLGFGLFIRKFEISRKVEEYIYIVVAWEFLPRKEVLHPIQSRGLINTRANGAADPGHHH